MMDLIEGPTQHYLTAATASEDYQFYDVFGEECLTAHGAGSAVRRLDGQRLTVITLSACWATHPVCIQGALMIVARAKGP